MIHTEMSLHFWILLPIVSSETMEWGVNPNMVEEAEFIQGREHIKAMCLMKGQSIDLDCQVGFTSQNVSKILWKVDGKLQTIGRVSKLKNPRKEKFLLKTILR